MKNKVCINCHPEDLLERGRLSVFLARVRRLQREGNSVFVFMIDKRKKKERDCESEKIEAL